MNQPVICLMGPTASGKTDLSLKIAEALSCEIVSVDSAMVYTSMDVGTAKPSPACREKIRHHLIDIRDPSEPYSAAMFQEDASALIVDIQKRNKIPLLVGGTMLYFKALQQGLSQLPGASPEIRARLSEEANMLGLEHLYARLQLIDPASAARICATDPQRIQRALEVYEISGQPLSYFLGQGNKQSNFEFINIALAPMDRTQLHRSIEERFMEMLDKGFLAEVERLYLRSDLHINLPAIRSVGYRQAWQYLDGQMNFEEMCNKAIAATRQLAKRQLTWLRHWRDVTTFNSEDPAIYEKVLTHLKNLNTHN